MIYYRTVDEKLSARELHDAAHDLLKTVLKKDFGIDTFCLEQGEHGKPFLADYPEIHFNLSHCCGMVLCGISDSPIGVDCELIRPYNGRAAKRVFTESELSLTEKSAAPNEMFFRLWTLKEALGKNIGTGIAGMKSYEFSFAEKEILCKSFPEKKLAQVILQKKWVVSICADNPDFQ